MERTRHLLRASTVLALALAACGGGGTIGETRPSESGTLAFVVTLCHEEPAGFVERQALHILHGDQDVTVMETPAAGPYLPVLKSLCEDLTIGRDGNLSISREVFQGVAVSPDGAAVVFEVTDDFSTYPIPLNLPPELEGIYFVRADGSGLRRLGPPGRLPFFINQSEFEFPVVSFAFSPDSRIIAFADKGLDAAGNEAGQIMTLDVGSGQRLQLTHLPPAPLPPGYYYSGTPSVVNPAFVDNQTIAFFTFANPDDLNSAGDFAPFTVSRDASDLKAAPLPVTLPGSQIIPTFSITADKPAAIELIVPGESKNYNPQGRGIREVFAIDGPNLLQLTDFQRYETGGAIVGVDRQTVFFTASANPLGTNPSENCQIFSIDRLGGNLRQLTQFSEGPQATWGCDFSTLYQPSFVGCATSILNQDSRTGMLVFYSNCDPCSTTHRTGAQIFAMRPEGVRPEDMCSEGGLRQLTHTRGVVKRGGVVTRELPGPAAYGPYAL
jgi:hypothetical protein